MFRSIAIATALFAAATAAQAGTATLNVECSHLEPKGAVLAALYSNADDYAANTNARYGRVNVTGAQATITFSDLPEGEYAIKMFHDVNGDGKMNSNPFGMPTEPFAFSNNAVGNMGPAKWEDAHFTVAAPATTQTIKF
jgi:uncharacterized protein (DUF2141 family)